jgi:hypothetical protein
LCHPGKYQDEEDKPFCKEFKPGVQLLATTVQTESGITTVMKEEQCPSGTLNDGSVGRMCVSCPPGAVQPERGREQCLKCSVYQYQKIDAATKQPDNKTCVDRPAVGVKIRVAPGNGGRYQKIYTGSMWHSPSILNPNASTRMYTCSNEGCPDDGAMEMKCKPGYDGPICMVCKEGFLPQLRACVDCGGSGADPASIAIFVGALLLALGLTVAVVRHRSFLASTGVFALAKILVAFVTLMTTVDSQFGVVWPAEFKRALAALSLLSLDFGVLASMLCAVRVSFYTNLICMTMVLVVVVATIYLSHAFMQHRHQHTNHDHAQFLAKAAQIRQSHLFTAIYLLTFAYPVVYVKVVELFGCHIVEGTAYLRADYSIECYTNHRKVMAVYSSIFLAIYVIGFPLYVGARLWSYRHQLLAQAHGPGQVCKIAPAGLLLGFLLDDYKLQLPCYIWEIEEMLRKLMLSVVGALWSQKSVTCIATALLLSGSFQVLHSCYWPFKTPGCNQLQQICLSVLNTVYIAGLMLKTETIEAGDQRDLGLLLVSLLVTAMLAVVLAVVLEIRELMRVVMRTRKITSVLRACCHSKTHPTIHLHSMIYRFRSPRATWAPFLSPSPQMHLRD